MGVEWKEREFTPSWVEFENVVEARDESLSNCLDDELDGER